MCVERSREARAAREPFASRLSGGHVLPPCPCGWTRGRRAARGGQWLLEIFGASEVSRRLGIRRARTVHGSNTTIVGVRIVVGLVVRSEPTWWEASWGPGMAAAEPSSCDPAAGTVPDDRPGSGDGAGEAVRDLESQRAGTVHEFHIGNCWLRPARFMSV